MDEPLDKPNLLRLTFNWGQAHDRTADDNVASARIGNAAHRWFSYEDRVIQEMVLPNRSAADSLHFQLSGRGFVWSRLFNGGYAVFDVALERFIIHGPSVTDATGKSSGAVVNWNYPDANISIDSAFLIAAQYPLPRRSSTPCCVAEPTTRLTVPP